MPAPRFRRAAAEQVVDLVGIAAQPGGRVHFPGADARHFVGFLDPGQGQVAAAQGLGFAGPVDGDQQPGGPAGVIDGVAAHLHAPAAAVTQLQVGGQHAQLAGLCADLRQLLGQLVLLAGRPQRTDRHGHERLSVPAEQAASGRIHIQDRQRVQVVHQDRPGVALEHLPMAGFRALQPRVGVQHVLGQRAQQQIDQPGAGHHEKRALGGLPARGGGHVAGQHLHRGIAAQDPHQGQHQVTGHHPPAVAAQGLGERAFGRGGVGQAGGSDRHGRVGDLRGGRTAS